MVILKDPLEVVNFIHQNAVNKKIGLVPTMGALHKGHQSLFERSKLENDITIASIFINPLQFNSKSDLDLYPRTVDTDIKLLENAGCDALFLPSNDVMYQKAPLMTMNFGYMEEVMEGKFRPGHFNGVGIVVAKLFNIIKPHNAYFGQKDLQQFLIIKQMVNDLSFQINLIPCPIIREEDGLAMSSRNKRLSIEKRPLAAKIYEALNIGKILLRSEGIAAVKEKVTAFINNHKDLQLEYFEIVDFETLKDVKNVKEHDKLALCIAVHLDGVRLIDNILYFP